MSPGKPEEFEAKTPQVASWVGLAPSSRLHYAPSSPDTALGSVAEPEDAVRAVPSVSTAQDTGAAVVASLVSKVPVLGDALAIVVTDAYKRRMAVAEQTALDIAQQSGGAGHLATRLAGDPQLEVMFLEAVEAATRTGLKDKRRLLSRVVGAAVLDDAKVEDGQLLVQALRELDAPHVRGLEMVRRVTDEP